MARYTANNDLGGTLQSLTTSYKTMMTLTAATATLTSAEIYEVIVGLGGAAYAATDTSFEADVSAVTAIGTGTTITPNKLDSTRRAAGTVGTANHTAEPTVTANSSVLKFALNQRATQRWVTVPDTKTGFEIPATNLAGFAIRIKSAGFTGAFGSAYAAFVE
jgi:hypothetical protein